MRDNSFDFLRFLAAFLVLLSHSYPLYGKSYEPLAVLTSLGTFGALAVSTFFVISGYLITASFARQASPRAYAVNRALRILPALAAAVALSAFALGPAMTTLPFLSYLTDASTWRYLGNMLLYPYAPNLPGVFLENPYAGIVNGSLWTLGIECTMYLLVALLGVAGLLRAPVTLGLACAGTAWFYDLLARQETSELFLGMKTLYLAKLSASFFFGATLYLARERIPLHGAGVLACLAGMWACAFTPYAVLGLVIFLPYAVIWLGLHGLPSLARFGKYGDFSYGFYLYAFPVQQTYMACGGARYGFAAFIVASTLVTLLFAIASWRLVEKRALAFKRRPLRAGVFP